MMTLKLLLLYCRHHSAGRALLQRSIISLWFIFSCEMHRKSCGYFLVFIDLLVSSLCIPQKSLWYSTDCKLQYKFMVHTVTCMKLKFMIFVISLFLWNVLIPYLSIKHCHYQYLCLINNRSVSEPQTPFTTYTEWRFSRKTLPLLGSGMLPLFLRGWGLADPRDILKRGLFQQLSSMVLSYFPVYL